jgi:hypothetical protein
MEPHVVIALKIKSLTLLNKSWREHKHIKGNTHKKLISKLLRKLARV